MLFVLRTVTNASPKTETASTGDAHGNVSSTDCWTAEWLEIMVEDLTNFLLLVNLVLLS